MPTLPPHPAIVHLTPAPATAVPLVAAAEAQVETLLSVAACGAAAAPGSPGGACGLIPRDLRLIGPFPGRSPR
jgi:hypothetical protein